MKVERKLNESFAIKSSNMPAITCKKCGTEFHVPPSRCSAKFCSLTCSNSWFVGKNARGYKENGIGYGGIHDWIKRVAGKASKCENERCTGLGKRFEWANISKKYKRDVSDWKQLCSKCHKVFDLTQDEIERLRSIASHPAWNKGLKGTMDVSKRRRDEFGKFV